MPWIGGIIAIIAVLGDLPSGEAQTASTLKHVQIVFRHGDRSQDKTFPNDLHPPSDWPQGYKQLTTLGVEQQFALGRCIRTRYGGFINATYINTEIYIQSSDLDRTIMSADANLAGLFPPQGEQIWNGQLLWQPIPVHTVPRQYDNMLLLDHRCSRYDAYYNMKISSEQARKYYLSNKVFIDKYYKLGGWPVTSSIPNILTAIWNMYDPLSCQVTHGMTIPEWATAEVIERLGVLRADKYVYWFEEIRMNLLRGGVFLGELMANIHLMTNGSNSPPRKTHLYSAHDNTLAAIMHGLDVWFVHNPPFAAALFFELHETSKNHYEIRVFYKNDTVENPLGPPVPLTIPGCEHSCPMDQFEQLIQPVIFDGTLDDWNSLCAQVDKPSDKGAVVVLAVFLILVAMAIAIVALIIYVKNKMFNPSSYVRA